MPGPRAYVSDFSIRVGPIMDNGKLIKLTKTSDLNKFVSVCPDCDEPRKVVQQYVCPESSDHGPFIQRELTVKAKDVGDGVLVKVTEDELRAARSSELDLNVFSATVHPRSEVEDNTYVGDNAYVFVPARDDEYHQLLVAMVSDPENAFVAMCNVRNNEGFYRLVVWRGHVVLQKLLWPEDLNEFENEAVEVDGTLADAAKAMIDRIKAPFDVGSYRSSVKERLQAITDAAASGTPVAVPAAPAKKKPDLLSLLSGFGKKD